MSEEDYQERYERESRRRSEIRDFRQQQRISREWIPVDELVEWCVASKTGANPAEAEKARSLALDRLDRSVRAGEFEVEGQARIKWTHPRFGEQWFTREQLSVFGTIRDQASRCWLPRELTRQWLLAHGYPWPAHFDPDGSVGEAGSKPTPAPVSIEAAIDETKEIKRLAEWIFSVRRQMRHFEKLLDAAITQNQLGTFTKGIFLTAFQKVYTTKRHAPPKTGWPLRSPYKERDEAEKSSK